MLDTCDLLSEHSDNITEFCECGMTHSGNEGWWVILLATNAQLAAES